MQIGILGTGAVGIAIGNKLVSMGHEVMLGSRTIDNMSAENWVTEHPGSAYSGNLSQAAAFGHLVFNCTPGTASLEALNMAMPANLANKILVDVANPFDFSSGMPPRLTICNDNSLGEEIQKLLPQTRVVKALNTVSVETMADPAINNGDIDLLICGNDDEAKAYVAGFLCTELGWRKENIIDLGSIVHARATEGLALLIMSFFMKYGNTSFGIKLYR